MTKYLTFTGPWTPKIYDRYPAPLFCSLSPPCCLRILCLRSFDGIAVTWHPPRCTRGAHRSMAGLHVGRNVSRFDGAQCDEAAAFQPTPPQGKSRTVFRGLVKSGWRRAKWHAWRRSRVAYVFWFRCFEGCLFSFLSLSLSLFSSFFFVRLFERYDRYYGWWRIWTMVRVFSFGFFERGFLPFFF